MRLIWLCLHFHRCLMWKRFVFLRTGSQSTFWISRISLRLVDPNRQLCDRTRRDSPVVPSYWHVLLYPLSLSLFPLPSVHHCSVLYPTHLFLSTCLFSIKFLRHIPILIFPGPACVRISSLRLHVRVREKFFLYDQIHFYQTLQSAHMQFKKSVRIIKFFCRTYLH